MLNKELKDKVLFKKCSININKKKFIALINQLMPIHIKIFSDYFDINISISASTRAKKE